MSELPPTSPSPATTAPPRKQAGQSRLSWFARRRVAALDAASARVHGGLLAQVSRGERPSGSTGTSGGVLALSVLVLVVYAVAVVLLVVATFASKNVVGWIGVVLGWLVVVAIAPRPNRLGDVRRLDATEHPSIHRHVAAVAEAVGTPAPEVVAVSTEFNAGVARIGWGRRQALVIGLPLWTLLTEDERLALLAHEMGHLRGRDTTVGHVAWTAHGVLRRFATLLTPLPSDAYSDFADYRLEIAASEATMNALAAFLLRIVSTPAILLLLLFERLAAVSSQRREYLADLRAAEVAGTRAVVRLLITTENLAGLHTLAGRGCAAPRGPVRRARGGARAPGPDGRAGRDRPAAGPGAGPAVGREPSARRPAHEPRRGPSGLAHLRAVRRPGRRRPRAGRRLPRAHPAVRRRADRHVLLSGTYY
ncbi:M48 family metallopeptidase [Terrabacter sp. MAHUQ-38]|uniref:M48 family metallopeptidase n=1 Tax=unclassified Terrabacter TaxID=2630222 RepID=UPI00165E54D3|nr:M48 family metalloprotease [Terrabacter sp. MAHUQ-38]